MTMIALSDLVLSRAPVVALPLAGRGLWDALLSTLLLSAREHASSPRASVTRRATPCFQEVGLIHPQ